MKILRLNNKGYMLVEIILASAIAMGIAYFITDLTIKLKNKNDDMLVKTLVSTDQAIIYNKLMKSLNDLGSDFDCNEINVEGNVFKYKEFTNIVSEYATLNYKGCEHDEDSINIEIELNVLQLKEENFDISIEYPIK